MEQGIVDFSDNVFGTMRFCMACKGLGPGESGVPGDLLGSSLCQASSESQDEWNSTHLESLIQKLCLGGTESHQDPLGNLMFGGRVGTKGAGYFKVVH
jgi:hypothetical protein